MGELLSSSVSSQDKSSFFKALRSIDYGLSQSLLKIALPDGATVYLSQSYRHLLEV